MPIRRDNLVVPLMGVNGEITLCRLGASGKTGMLAIAGIAADGVPIALKVAAMNRQRQAGPVAMACDEVPVPLKGGLKPPGMILIFIDESSTYFPNGHSLWDEDVSRWNAYVAGNGPPQYAAVHKVDGYPTLDIVPSGRSCPPEIHYRTIRRNPQAGDLVAAYEDCKGGAEEPPREVVLCIDISGSMYRATMQPGIDGFEAWLDNGGTFTPAPEAPLPAIPWREVYLSDERWLYLTCNLYEDG